MAGWLNDGIFEDFEGNEQTSEWDLFYEVSGEAKPVAPEPARQAPAMLSGPTSQVGSGPLENFTPFELIETHWAKAY